MPCGAAAVRMSLKPGRDFPRDSCRLVYSFLPSSTILLDRGGEEPSKEDGMREPEPFFGGARFGVGTLAGSSVVYGTGNKSRDLSEESRKGSGRDRWAKSGGIPSGAVATRQELPGPRFSIARFGCLGTEDNREAERLAEGWGPIGILNGRNSSKRFGGSRTSYLIEGDKRAMPPKESWEWETGRVLAKERRIPVGTSASKTVKLMGGGDPPRRRAGMRETEPVFAQRADSGPVEPARAKISPIFHATALWSTQFRLLNHLSYIEGEKCDLAPKEICVM